MKTLLKNISTELLQKELEQRNKQNHSQDNEKLQQVIKKLRENKLLKSLFDQIDWTEDRTEEFLVVDNKNGLSFTLEYFWDDCGGDGDGGYLINSIDRLQCKNTLLRELFDYLLSKGDELCENGDSTDIIKSHFPEINKQFSLLTKEREKVLQKIENILNEVANEFKVNLKQVVKEAQIIFDLYIDFI